MSIENMLAGFAVLVATVALIVSFLAMTQIDAFVAGVQADFFECPPDNTLVVCAVGTSPPPADMCEAVGSGTTTIPPQNC